MSAGTTAGIVGSFIAPRAQDTRQRHRDHIVDYVDQGDGGDGLDNVGIGDDNSGDVQCMNVGDKTYFSQG